jgi:Rod binding domain-containing protein
MVQQNEGEKVFEDMLYDEYSKQMSKTAGFDLADNLYKQMAFLQNLPKAAG